MFPPPLYFLSADILVFLLSLCSQVWSVGREITFFNSFFVSSTSMSLEGKLSLNCVYIEIFTSVHFSYWQANIKRLQRRVRAQCTSEFDVLSRILLCHVLFCFLGSFSTPLLSLVCSYCVHLFLFCFFCSIHDLLSNSTFLFLVLLCSYGLLFTVFLNKKSRFTCDIFNIICICWVSTFWYKCMCFTLTHSLPHPTPMYCMLTKFYYTICDKQLSLFFFFSRHSRDHQPNKKKYLQLIHKFIYTVKRNGSI